MSFAVASGIDYSHVITNFKSVWNVYSGVHLSTKELSLDLVFPTNYHKNAVTFLSVIMGIDDCSCEFPPKKKIFATISKKCRY